MEMNYKLQIYKGIIQYILESTNYSLENIADLSNSSIKNIRTIYCDNYMPSNFSSEMQLVRLYQMIMEIHIQENQFKKYLPLPKSFRQLSVSME
ncbi:TPA: hypothetical protein JA989_12265 [Legionella pneumophila]|uniref:hypothetical protein n=1 Tax=Legionella pneumophila TaxID=446 RepID=UPI0007773613|nr:hypothetical protein [Legionella pneumophila]HAT8648909.1 hypothetical protein [Legionella pneumophila]